MLQIYHATCRHDAAKGSSITNHLLAGPSVARATPPPPPPPPPADEAKPDVKPDPAALASSNKRKSPEPPSPTPAAQEEENGGCKRVKLEQDGEAPGQQPL